MGAVIQSYQQEDDKIYLQLAMTLVPLPVSPAKEPTSEEAF